ncbi:MAG: DUF2927 domain-containing protein, partial [Candidatus Neomarinimicrobiota bacterium]
MKTTLIAFMFLLIGCSFRSNSNNYSQEAINYFIEIALGAEFGDKVPVIKKWTNDIRVKVSGVPTGADLLAIINTIDDLNELTGNVNIKLVENNWNLTINFSPETDFATIEKNYVPTNYGFFWVLWDDASYVIYDARILISTEDISQEERS